MNQEWLIATLKDLQQDYPQYQQQALLESCQRYVAELGTRLENSEGELDGRIWNHEQW